jgi:hypothetical protein
MALSKGGGSHHLAPLQDILGGKWGNDFGIGNFVTLVIPARFTEISIAIHRTSRMEEGRRKRKRGKKRKRTRERNGKQSCLELGILIRYHVYHWKEKKTIGTM